MRRFIQKYRELSAPVKASLWFVVSNVIQKGVSLLATPIFTRLLTTEQYGVYSVYQSWYSIITIFATLNLSAGVFNNGMVKWPNDRKRFTASMQGLSTSITMALFVIYLLGQDFWNRLLGLNSVFLFAMFAEMLFVPAFNYWAAGQRFDYQYRALVIVTVIIAVVSPAIGVLAVLSTDYKAEARVLAFVFVQVCVGLVFYIKNAVNGKCYFNRKYWKFALGFNLPLIPHYLSQTVLNQADRIMIQRMIGSSDAALYSVAYSMAMMFSIVTNAINNSFIPYSYKAIRDKKYEALRKNASFLVLMIAVACVLVTAFAPEVIRIFAAPEYYDAYRVIPPITISLLFIFMTSLFGNIEFYFEQTRFIMLASSVAAVLNVVLNYFAIPMWGYAAAGYTTLICYIVLTVAHYLACRILLKQRKKKDDDLPSEIYDIGALLRIAIISLASMVLMSLIYQNLLARYSVILVVFVILVMKRRMIMKQFKDIIKK